MIHAITHEHSRLSTVLVYYVCTLYLSMYANAIVKGWWGRSSMNAPTAQRRYDSQTNQLNLRSHTLFSSEAHHYTMHTLYSDVLLNIALLHYCTIALLHCCTIALLHYCHCLLFLDLVHCYAPYAIQPSLGCDKRFSILYSIAET